MKERSYQEIRDALFGRLRQTSGKKVAYNHRIATHIGEEDQALDAYLAVLNKVALFAQDGVYLTPGDVPQKGSVEDLLGAIFTDYKNRDWRIYYA